MADFEEAVAATGLGKFNIAFLCLMLPSAAAISFEVVQMSYVLPVAECDLDLTLMRKGMLNAIPFVGLIVSGPIWGCMADTLGRRMLMITCYFAHGVLTVLCGLQRNYYSILMLKFCSGVAINGAASGYYTCISEFHSSKYRGKIFMFNGMMISLGAAFLPFIAWGVLSQKIDVTIFGDFIRLKAWNFYILATSTASWLSTIGHIIFPENPKFLMMSGKPEAALEVFRKMFRWNTGNPPESYPITEVAYVKQETEADITANRTRLEAIKEAPKQLKPMFLPPYVWYLLIVTGMQFSCMWTYNGLRMWLPNIFKSLEEYHKDRPDEFATVCNVLDLMSGPKNATATEKVCKEFIQGLSTYMRNIIATTVNFTVYTIEAVIIDTLIGRRTAVIVNTYTSALCGLCLYFIKPTWMITGLISTFVAFAGVCVNINMSIAAGLFPTSTRALALGMTMMAGRIGTIVGNNLFPVILKGGCWLTILVLSGMVVICGSLTFLIPKQAKET